jgi:hypothetical protein
MLPDVVRSLRRQRISLLAGDELGDMEFARICNSLRTGFLQHKVLGIATNFRILKLQMPGYGRADPDKRPAIGLNLVIGSLCFPNLIELALSYFVTTEDGLVEFLLRHASTLRRITLIAFELERGIWRQAFTQVAGKMSRFYSVELGDAFKAEEALEGASISDGTMD